MLVIRLLLGLSVVMVLGHSILFLLWPKGKPKPFLLHLALSWGIGSGLLSPYMILLSLLGPNLTLGRVLVPLLIISLGLILYRYGKYRHHRNQELPFRKISFLKKIPFSKNLRVLLSELRCGGWMRLLEVALVGLIVFQIAWALFFALLFPVRFWDAILSWSFKARAFYLDGNLFDFYRSHHYPFSQPAYPLLLPLLETWLYLSMGAINENLMKVIFPLFFASTLAVFYSFLRIRFSRLYSLLCTAFLASTPIMLDHAYIEYADLPFAFYYLTGILFLGQWSQDREQGTLLLSILFTSFTALVRSEGMFFLLFNLILILLLTLQRPKENLFPERGSGLKGGRFYPPLVGFLLALILLSPWLILNGSNGLGLWSGQWRDLELQGLDIYRIGEVAAGFGLGFLFPIYNSTSSFLGSGYGALWVLLGVALALNLKKIRADGNLLLLGALVFGLMLYLSGAIFVADFLRSAERYLLHLFPIAMFLTANLLGD